MSFPITVCRFGFCRGFVVLLACALAPLFVGLRTAVAEMPSREIWRSGSMSVTAIQDLPGEMTMGIFKGPAPEKEKAQYFNKDGKAEAGFNVFLLRMGNTTALFDSGNGTLRGTPGRLPEILASLGVKPEDIDYVLLTHLHMDHMGGLLQGEKRAFPKAKLMMSKPEIAYWTALAEKDPANRNAAQVKIMVKAYGADLLPPFAFGDAPLPGVTALDASGHTPGHTVFRIDATEILHPLDTPGNTAPQTKAGQKSLLVVGDLIHGTPLQFALPEECAVYDVDPPKAILARKRILHLAEQQGIPIAGMHFPFPGEGKVEKDGKTWKFTQPR